ncbi:MAG: nucleotidyltransferase family protein [Planctomycetota bacterium]
MKQSELLQFAIGVLERLEISYALVGSFASGAYGEPRFTQDIDILVDLKRDQIDALCDSFPADEFYVSRPTIKEAVYRRRPFNVIHTPSANKLDFVLSRDDAWGRSQIARRRLIEVVDGCSAFVASPEDVILGKLLYYREGGSEKHLRDILEFSKLTLSRSTGITSGVSRSTCRLLMPGMQSLTGSMLAILSE